MLIKLKSKKFYKASFKFGSCGNSNKEAAATGSPKGYNSNDIANGGIGGEIKWEMRPGGMLVQKRENGSESSGGEGVITVKVSTVSSWHDISIEATSTFGELKMVLALVTGLEPREQRLLFKGKEREDNEYLHMVGVRDKDKVLLLEDPAIKEMKLHGLIRKGSQPICTSANPVAYRTISV